ncbi:MAG: hypothetical protein KME35_00225 [Aphanocapsa sp. GSE-SYN-MK-11-07L]|nr:hypothetical protein [Aphanocapsa sp. GSE-SYN-MK-11-07L]
MKNVLKAVVVTALALPIATLTAYSAQAEAVVFNLINRSGMTMMRFYASPVGVRNWEEDILGSGVLHSGRYTRIRINDGRTTCKYDFRAVFADGTRTDKYGVDICRLGSYTIH